MNSRYFDTTYLFKLQCEERGTSEVRACASKVDQLVCGLHGRTEFVSSCHRKIREGHGTHQQLSAIMAQVEKETLCGALYWLPITVEIVNRIESVYRNAPSSTFLRAFDALHLGCAAEHGFREIYSNDVHLLAAAPLFGLTGINVIPHQ